MQDELIREIEERLCDIEKHLGIIEYKVISVIGGVRWLAGVVGALVIADVFMKIKGIK